MIPALDPKQGYIQICIAYDVSLIMFRRECIANYVSQYVSQHLYRISCIAYYCIAYHVSHFMSRTSCIASPICKAMGGHGAPEATRGHGRPRQATGGHGPHPTVPPKILYLLKWAGRGRQKGRLRRKPATGGHGGPRGATARHQKSPDTTTAPQYPRGPIQAAPVWGTNILIY